MHKILWLSLLLATALSQVGCAGIPLSDKEPFAELIGEPQELLRPALLMSGQTVWEDMDEGAEHEFHGAPYQLYDRDESSNSWRKSGWLPSGTRIVIDQVEYASVGLRVWGVLARGEVDLPDGSTRRFVYHWNDYARCAPIKRAPWEPLAAKERRQQTFASG